MQSTTLVLVFLSAFLAVCVQGANECYVCLGCPVPWDKDGTGVTTKTCGENEWCFKNTVGNVVNKGCVDNVANVEEDQCISGQCICDGNKCNGADANKVAAVFVVAAATVAAKFFN